MKIIITAGGTRENIDPVRFISNASTGKMGYALARAAVNAGHEVLLITAVTSMKQPNGAEVVSVVSAKEMYEAVRLHFAWCECLIMSAAVSDYTPVKPFRTKIKKHQNQLVIHLKPTVDILRWSGRHKKGQVVVGFALEDTNLIKNAEQKLKDKNLDMIVANGPAAIGADISTVHIKTVEDGWFSCKNKSKAAIAKCILKIAEKIYGK